MSQAILAQQIRKRVIDRRQGIVAGGIKPTASKLQRFLYLGR